MWELRNWTDHCCLMVVGQIPTASIGLYINCGSVYETPESSGASHLLERMAFKSTSNRSHLRIVREVEAIGGTVQASASREQMSYTISSLKTYVPEMVELLLDSVRNPVFLDWEVNEEVSFHNPSVLCVVGEFACFVADIGSFICSFSG